MDIYPSILSGSAARLADYIGKNFQFFPHFQIDIADGIFVKNKTVSLSNLVKYLGQNQLNIPAKTTFEFHLMVEDFESVMPDIDQITAHLSISEVIIHLQPSLRWMKGDHTPLHEKLHSYFPYSFGVAINPEVDVLNHYEILQHFETIQIMTIHPGRQGQALIPKTLKKITQLRKHGYGGRIVLDGAMNDKNLPNVLRLEHWPDAICPGSYLKTNVENRLAKLQKIVIKEQDKRLSG